MAANDAIPVPRKNTAYRFYFAIRKPSDSTLITTWTGQDSEVSLDGAAYSDCTNEATEIGTTGTGYIDLTSSEMNADCVLLKVTVTNTGAVPLVFVLYPEEVGDYRANMAQISGDSTAADTLELFAEALDQSTGQIDNGSFAAGAIDAAAIAAGAIDAATFAADVDAEILSYLVDDATRIDASALNTATGTSIPAIVTNTGTTLVEQIEDVQATADAILIDTGTTLQAEVDGIQATLGSAGAGLTSIPNSAGVTTLLSRLQEQIALTPGGAVTVATVLTDAIDAAAIAASAVTEIQNGLATAANLATVAGYLDTEIMAILEDTGTTIPAQIAALNNLSSANVLTQVNAALDTAIAELSAGVPSATPTTRTALMLLYMALRNRTTTTATAQTIQNDAGTTIATATLSDDGTTMTKAEFA